jgi:hypothetical protein
VCLAQLERFAKAFYYEQSPFPPLPDCKIYAPIHKTGSSRSNPQIDILWLAAFLHQHPNNRIKFSGGGSYKWEAEGLSELPGIITANSAWRTRLADLHDITLYTKTWWRPGCVDEMAGYYLRRPKWRLEIVLKGEAAAAWWGKVEERRPQAEALLLDLGLETPARRALSPVSIEMRGQR